MIKAHQLIGTILIFIAGAIYIFNDSDIIDGWKNKMAFVLLVLGGVFMGGGGR